MFCGIHLWVISQEMLEDTYPLYDFEHYLIEFAAAYHRGKWARGWLMSHKVQIDVKMKIFRQIGIGSYLIGLFC